MQTTGEMAMTLDKLKIGHTAVVTGVRNQSTERRRLYDLGITPGTPIENVMPSPLGDPIAYRVRSAVVALRREQAQLIDVEE
jgi:ferrous iron transport protein A